MNSAFILDNLIVFELNNVKYALPDKILKEMSIFNILFDDDNDVFNKSILKIKWSVTPEIIDNVFKCMYNICAGLSDITENFLFNTMDHVKYCLDVVSFMKYLGIDCNIINIVIKHILKGIDAANFCLKCLEFDYCSDMIYILRTNYMIGEHILNSNNIQYFEDISSSHFPIDFKIESLKRAIICSRNIKEFDILLKIKGEDNSDVFGISKTCHILCLWNNINKICRSFNCNISSCYVKYHDLKIIEISIDGNKIEYQNMLKFSHSEMNCDKSIFFVQSYLYRYGRFYVDQYHDWVEKSKLNSLVEVAMCNIAEPIATYVAKILLSAKESEILPISL
jgi:hypothetical protein